MKFVYRIFRNEMLKDFLHRHSYSRKTISAIKNNGALVVNNEHVTVRKKLTEGDELVVCLPQEQPSFNLQPYHSPLTILFEDDYILIVSKSANQNIAPSREHLHQSLVEQVLAYLQQSFTRYVPHIVTLLDRNTSGIVIFTKHGYIHHLMSETQIDKRYLCICMGKVQDNGIIKAPIKRHPDSIIQRMVDPTGKYAETHFKCLASTDNFSLCQVKLLTGRTHQIRVHFQHIGHPLVGDGLYGGITSRYHHQLLQCMRVSFTHPITQQIITIEDQTDKLTTIYNML